jgi:tetratricopeptide (TPR) repeat protein
MTPELWQRLKPLYEVAIETPEEQRAQFVAEACKDDAILKDELEKLLQSSTHPTFSFDTPLIQLGKLFQDNQKTLSPGHVLLRRFQIVRHLGSGGMGDVYEALDLHLQKGRIALKIIRSSIAQNPAILTRFKAEVILARKISGPNVCRIHEFFEPTEESESDCVAFLTMEYLEGMTLSERIETDGPLPLKEATSIAYQLCAALQSIHDVGVIHRDLKPRNIMLVPHNGAEKAMVMDFGLAHAVSGASLTEETRNTVPGMIMGTPEYMAPEQFEGREVTPATDIYALGVVLYELVTGKRMYAASTPFAAALRRGRRPDAPSSMRHGIPPAWDDVITKCLEFDAERRYQSISEVIEALHQHRFVIWRSRQGQRITLAGRSLVVIAGAILAVIGSTGWFLLRDAFAYHMSPEVKKWYDQGASDLREGTYLKATREFEMAAQLDGMYPLTHALLAEAWNELDFNGEAQKQLLYATAPDPKIALSKMDKKYIDAVRTTLIHNYSAAAQDYEEILKSLPKDQKPQGMVDLGRAYEKAGRMKEALDRYEEAAKLNPNNPAPFVHLGILRSRRRDPTAADTAFTQAEKLYKASSNQEGLAEVDYQRGYAANEQAAYDRAREFLNKSLATAIEIDSVQLRVRTLSQLSSVEHFARQNEKAIAYANLVIQLSRDNGLEYWTAEGWMRLGNAYLLKGDIPNAESSAQQSLKLARQNHHPRIEADADSTLASVRDQEGKSDEAISYAEAALKYYKDYGFMNAAAKSSVFIIRAEERKGDPGHALTSANELLRVAREYDDSLWVAYAEEAIGDLSLDEEDFPSALMHFEGALQASRSVPAAKPYAALHCADVLWQLGRYGEAEEMLAAVPSDSRNGDVIASGLERVRAEIQLSQLQNRAALATAQSALLRFHDMPPYRLADFEEVIAIAEAQLGQTELAQRDVDKLMTLAHKEGGEDMLAAAQLVEAEVLLASRESGQAGIRAETAYKYFALNGSKESEWLSLLYMAKAAKASGDAESSSADAQKAIDILKQLENNWGPPIFQRYAARPDHQLAIRELSGLSNLKGNPHHVKR